MRDLAIAVVWEIGWWIREYWIPLVILGFCVFLVGLLIFMESKNPCLKYSNEPPIYVQVGHTMVPIRECLERVKGVK